MKWTPMRPYRSSFVAFALFRHTGSRPSSLRSAGRAALRKARLPLRPSHHYRSHRRRRQQARRKRQRLPEDGRGTPHQGQKTEISRKDQSGRHRSPADVPLGRVLIQVVADGWKTYGHWYDINRSQANHYDSSRSSAQVVLNRRVLVHSRILFAKFPFGASNCNCLSTFREVFGVLLSAFLAELFFSCDSSVTQVTSPQIFVQNSFSSPPLAGFVQTASSC